MNGPASKLARCAIYTRKSTEYNLELAFNSLDAQREACEAYIKSQAHEGWRLIPDRYDSYRGAAVDQDHHHHASQIDHRIDRRLTYTNLRDRIGHLTATPSA